MLSARSKPPAATSMSRSKQASFGPRDGQPTSRSASTFTRSSSTLTGRNSGGSSSPHRNSKGSDTATNQQRPSFTRSATATPLSLSKSATNQSPRRNGAAGGKPKGFTNAPAGTKSSAAAQALNIDDEGKRFMLLSPKSTTSINGSGLGFDSAVVSSSTTTTTGTSSFVARDSSLDRSSQLAAFIDTPRVDQENRFHGSLGAFGSQSSFGGCGANHTSTDPLSAGDAGSPEEGCWLMKKEELIEARSDQKPVLHRKDPSTSRRSSAASLTPRPVYNLSRRSSSATFLSEEEEQQFKELDDLNKQNLAHPTQRSGSSPAMFGTTAEDASVTEKELRFGSVSTGRSESAPQVGTPRPDATHSTTPRPTADTSPIPNAPISPRPGVGEAIAFGVFSKKTAVVEATGAPLAPSNSPAPPQSSTFTATRVGGRRTTRGVVVGTPPPSPRAEGLNFREGATTPRSTPSSRSVSAPASPTTELAGPPESKNGHGGIVVATPSSDRELSCTRLFSEEAVIAPSATTAAVVAPSIAVGAQTTGVMSVSLAIQADVPQPVPTPTVEPPKKVGIDMCVGGDEPLPAAEAVPTNTTAETSCSPMKFDAPPPPMVTFSEISIQTEPMQLEKEVVVVVQEAQPAPPPPSRREASPDPFDAPNRSKKVNDGCCTVM